MNQGLTLKWRSMKLRVACRKDWGILAFSMMATVGQLMMITGSLEAFQAQSFMWTGQYLFATSGVAVAFLSGRRGPGLIPGKDGRIS